MAAAGFGHIRIIDRDSVELSNLNRQILHSTKSIGKNKTDSALETLSRLNPDIEIETFAQTIDSDNIDRLVSDSDMIMDAMDNFQTRYILNRIALKNKIPLFHGAISGCQGQATTIIPGRSACLACIFPKAPPASTFPALGATCGIIGSIQVAEALKFVLRKGDLLENRLLVWDGTVSRMDEITYERNPRCKDCSIC
jgi:adenylyltransferase/sulfurtransferase